MKKGISLVLVLVMCLSLCACGKSQAVKAAEEAITDIGEISIDSKDAIENAEKLYNALSDKEKEQVENYNTLVNAQKAYVFELSKEAYNNICKAYKIMDKLSTDLYEGWRIGATESSSYFNADNCAQYLTKTMSLTEEELREGIAYWYVSHHAKIDGVQIEYDWDSATEEDKAELRKLDWAFFNHQKKASETSFVGPIIAVQQAYTVRGDIDEIRTFLDEATTQMKELSKEYSDYEHYPNLKGFYSTADSFFEFCMKPEGSFNQAKITIKDYRDTARDYQSDLDYIFGE